MTRPIANKTFGTVGESGTLVGYEGVFQLLAGASLDGGVRGPDVEDSGRTSGVTLCTIF